MKPISEDFVARLERFASEQGVPLIRFEKGQPKDDVAQEYLARFKGREGLLFIGKAQEKTPVFRTERHRHPKSGHSYAWIVPCTGMVNHSLAGYVARTAPRHECHKIRQVAFAISHRVPSRSRPSFGQGQ
jgi:hypothetical protein